MSWYATENFGDLDPDNVSLIVAFCNLAQRFDIYLDPHEMNALLTQDDPVVDWWSAPEYIAAIDVGEISGSPGWPTGSNAIVKFRRLDTKSAGMVDHYCLVADQRVHSIIDSLDGKIKSASIYGEPQAWGNYVMPIKEEEELPAAEPEPEEKVPANMTYRVLSGGENIWDIARRLNIPGKELIAVNNITDSDLPAGTLIRLPVELPEIDDKPIIEYELLARPVDMHISRLGGARKYAFGNVRKWKDVAPVGPTYAENANIKVYAIAHVPIEEDGSIAAYFMDKLDLGDYRNTGRASLTAGFSHAHLTEGFIERPVTAVTEQLQEQLDQTQIALEAAQNEADELAVPDAELPHEHEDSWKETIQPINPDDPDDVIMHITKEELYVRDLSGRAPVKRLVARGGYPIKYTFIKDGKLYGMPPSHDQTGFWRGIPMDMLETEDEAIGSYERSLVERVATNGKLSFEEKYWYVPLSRLISTYTRIQTIFGKTKE